MSSGDFAEVVFQEIQLRSTVERSDMTIDEVNDQLDLLSRTNKLLVSWLFSPVPLKMF